MIYTKNWNCYPKYMVFYTNRIDAKMKMQNKKTVFDIAWKER
jgi:hypothetical protein